MCGLRQLFNRKRPRADKVEASSSFVRSQSKLASLEADPNAATPVAASRPNVSPPVLFGVDGPIVIVVVQPHLWRIGVLFLDAPAIAVVIAHDGGGSTRGECEGGNERRGAEILHFLSPWI